MDSEEQTTLRISKKTKKTLQVKVTVPLRVDLILDVNV